MSDLAFPAETPDAPDRIEDLPPLATPAEPPLDAPPGESHRKMRRRSRLLASSEASPDAIPEAPLPAAEPETPTELPPDAIPELPLPAAEPETPTELPPDAIPETPLPETPPGLTPLAGAEATPENPSEPAPDAPPTSAPAAVRLRIAVIVCTHNRYDTLGDTLRSLEAQSLPEAEFEILVVDNSTALQAQQKFWRLHKPPANGRVIFEAIPGLSRARNIGRRQTEAPVVVYIDDDAVASPDWLSILVNVFESTPECGIAGGPVVPVWTYPGHWPEWLHPWQRGFLTIVDRGPRRRALDQGEWLAGTNIAFRRELLERFGGFNEGLGRIGNSLLSNEELEVSDKIAAAGFTTWYDHNARVLHRVHANRVSQAWIRRRVSWQAISDQMSSSPKIDDDACWTRLAEYFQQMPVEMRGVRGLFLDVPNPELYYAQCRAIEALVTLLIGSGRDPEGRT